MLELDVRVVARKQEAQGICSFELESTTSQSLPVFSAGAHIDVQVAPGLVRQYSLCSDPAVSGRWRIGVLQDPKSRGGSVAMHERAQVGTVLKVGMPRNLFSLVSAPHTVLIAGGIGVTPILSMAIELSRQGKPFEMHYCARSPQRMAFREELLEGAFGDRVNCYFSDEPASQAFDAQRVLEQAPPGAHLYVCGPDGFMTHVLTAARESAWSEDRLHREHFASAVPAGAVDQAFEVQLGSSGQVLQVPADRTVLQVLLDHGVDVPFSCESGVCGTCVPRVLQGAPDHRDSYLTDAERAANDQFTPCCSRAKSSTLVLDL